MKNHFSNIEKMEKAVKDGKGFDWIIVVSSDKNQAKFWQERLKNNKSEIAGKKVRIISQYEDWPGGAGQLFGTLYAFQKANRNGRLESALKNGKSIAIYHTAGKGKRIAPLIFSEGGNKPAIKLPKILGKGELLTILETVIFQTQVFAGSRKGRLCVFWGDQVVIPSDSYDFNGESHVEIFGIRREIPKKRKTWEKDWEHYGILAMGGGMEFLQREKISWQEFQKIKKGLNIKTISRSLGFFSMSQSFLNALIEEFIDELKEKNGKLDTDFHLWMPLTSSRDEFLSHGGNKEHWRRIDDFKKRFLGCQNTSLVLIKDKNLGEKTLWWDFGQVSFYLKNLLKMLMNNLEGRTMRRFFGIQSEKNPLILNSKIKGMAKNSIIINSKANNLMVEKAVIINSDIFKLSGKNILVYNLKDNKCLKFGHGKVACDVFLKKNKRIMMQTNIKRDGKMDWEKRVLNNPFSYKDLESYYDEQGRFSG